MKIDLKGYHHKHKSIGTELKAEKLLFWALCAITLSKIITIQYVVLLKKNRPTYITRLLAILVLTDLIDIRV